MFCNSSLSKHFITVEVRGTGLSSFRLHTAVFLGIGTMVADFRHFGTVQVERGVKDGSESLCQLVCAVSQYSPRNPVWASCLPRIPLAEHPPHLLCVNRVCQGICGWGWYHVGLTPTHFITCEVVVELLSQVAAGASVLLGSIMCHF